MEEYTFLAMIDAALAAGLQIVTVPCDEHGILPEELAKRLPGAKVLYTVPVGQNPLGHRMSSERYQAIYDLCASKRGLKGVARSVDASRCFPQGDHRGGRRVSVKLL